MKLYTLLQEEMKSTVLGCWSKHLNGYSIVIGYSVTGAIFLKNPKSNEYLILYPSMEGNNCKTYGSFTSNEEFEDKILKDTEFPAYGLYPITLEELLVLEDKLGPCKENEILSSTRSGNRRHRRVRYFYQR